MPTSGSTPRLIVLGCGYLGRAIAERAVAHGWAVEALRRDPLKARALREELGIGVLESDLASDAWHGALDPNGAWVVDCVSSGRGGIDGYRHAYLEGARSIARWLRCRGHPVGLVYTGSTSVYPQTDGGWVDESSPIAPSTPLNAVLLETETTFRAALADGLVPRVALLRLAGLYGPGRHHLIDQMRAGQEEIAGGGAHYLNLIHRDDAAEAVFRIVHDWSAAGVEVFNVADGKPALKREVLEWTAHRLGRQPPVFRPDQVSERARRRALAPGGVPNRRIRSDKLRRATGWLPQYPDFRAGYAALLAP